MDGPGRIGWIGRIGWMDRWTVGWAGSSRGATVLHDAADRGHAVVCKILLEADQFLRVAADLQDDSGDTALHYAARAGHAEVSRT